jgi:hypothetical protein
MLLSKKYARALIKKGQAVIIGEVISAHGVVFIVIDNLKMQRTDHYLK